jgi:outer membrane protein assembly factor BamD
MFEGDGSSSWYDFMIPQTQSVISMDDNITTQVPKKDKSESWYDFLIPNF